MLVGTERVTLWAGSTHPDLGVGIGARVDLYSKALRTCAARSWRIVALAAPSLLSVGEAREDFQKTTRHAH